MLIVLGVHSCQISARNSALKDYNNSVASLIAQSDSTGVSLFAALTSGVASHPSAVQTSVNEARAAAESQYAHVRGLSVPSEMQGAQHNLSLAFQMRADAISDIAAQVQPAVGTTTNTDAVDAIAADMARLYASDVVYKDYTTTLIAAALHSAGIAVGGANGETIASGQIVTDLAWLDSSVVATRLGAKVAKSGRISPGLHGHKLNSVSVAGTTLQTGATNTVTASPAPTFTLNFTNSGTNDETNVVCEVTVSGTSISGTATVARTTPNETTTCDVQLNSSPPAGSATVVATIKPVPGERNIANNTLSFPVTFQ